MDAAIVYELKPGAVMRIAGLFLVRAELTGGPRRPGRPDWLLSLEGHKKEEVP
jgi:hypothetical protein